MSENQPIIGYVKPSDARSWSLCLRRAWFDNHPPKGFKVECDEFARLIISLGLEHEKRTINKLKEDHEVIEAQSSEHTLELMKQGIDIIFQAQLIDNEEKLFGKPDFLIRQANGQYQVADAKLSLDENKKDIQVQIGFYRKLLKNDLPGIVFQADGSRKEMGDKSNKEVNKFIEDMRILLATDEMPKVRYGHSKCSPCPYYTICKPDFVKKDDLSLIYGIEGRAADNLEKENIQTITQLINLSAEEVPDVPYFKGVDKKHRCILQAKSWKTDEVFKLNNVYLPKGNWVHFDIEDNPLTLTGNKHVYLWGFLVPEYTKDSFEYVWTDTEEQDRIGWDRFLDKINVYRKNVHDLILIHYSNHECATIKMYAKRYAMEDNETVLWLLGDSGPLFDIQKAVTDNLILPVQGYGLKDICKHKDLVNFQWEVDDSGSQWSVVQFNKYLRENSLVKKESIKNEILGYNRDDVIATRRLEEWLRNNYS